MSYLSHLLIPVGILATVGAAVSSSPAISEYGETIGVVSLLIYFLWERTNECKQLRKENSELINKLTSREVRDDHERNEHQPINKNEHENSN